MIGHGNGAGTGQGFCLASCAFKHRCFLLAQKRTEKSSGTESTNTLITVCFPKTHASLILDQCTCSSIRRRARAVVTRRQVPFNDNVASGMNNSSNVRHYIAGEIRNCEGSADRTLLIHPCLGLYLHVFR